MKGFKVARTISKAVGSSHNHSTAHSANKVKHAFKHKKH